MSCIREMSASRYSDSEFVIQTRRQQWVIPVSSTMMRCLIDDQTIRPVDLRFINWRDCQKFIRQLLLLALEDEYKNLEPSPLAVFARELIKTCPKQQ